MGPAIHLSGGGISVENLNRFSKSSGTKTKTKPKQEKHKLIAGTTKLTTKDTHTKYVLTKHGDFHNLVELHASDAFSNILINVLSEDEVDLDE